MKHYDTKQLMVKLDNLLQFLLLTQLLIALFAVTILLVLLLFI